MPCRPMLCDIYIRFWNHLNFELFSMNSYNTFDYYKIRKNLKNIIYLQSNVIFDLKAVQHFSIRRLKAETPYFWMKKFWSTLSQHMLPKWSNISCVWYARFSNKWVQHDDAVVNTCWPACHDMILLSNYGIQAFQRRVRCSHKVQFGRAMIFWKLLCFCTLKKFLKNQLTSF